MTQATPERSRLLAFVAGSVAVAIGALVFRGWTVEGKELDWLPCFVAVLLSWFLLRVLGRLEGRELVYWSGLFCGLTVIAGKLLASDAFGLIARASGDPVDSELDWIYRSMAIWSQSSTMTRYANAALVIASPLLAMSLTPLLARWRPLAERFRWPGRTAAHVDPSAESSIEFESSIEVDQRGPMPKAIVGPLGLWLLLVALAYGWYGTGDRTGFRMITVPADRHHAAYPIIGFSVLVDQRPVMAETLPAIEQVTWFSGGVRSDNNFRFLRAGYGFVGAQLAPFFGQRGGLLAINFVGWGISLLCVGMIAKSWFVSPVAAATAVAFAAVGLGFAIHINDTIPHVMSFAMYFGGVLLLWRQGIAHRECDWPTHALIGVSFGLMSLAYNVAQMLLLVYFLLGWRAQRWAHMGLAAAITLAFRPIWRWMLPAIGINVELVESRYFAVAMGHWQDYREAGLDSLLSYLVHYSVEILTCFESPWVLLLGLLGFGVCRFPAHARWFSICVVGIPALACLVFAPSTSARGYIVYGASIIVYVCAGGLIAEMQQRSKRWRSMIAAAVIALLVCQFFWATSHHRSWLGPAKAYFVGWDDGWEMIRNFPSRVVSLSESQRTPMAFGGEGTMQAAGAVDTASVQPIEPRSRILMLLNRLPFFAGFSLLGCLVWRSLPGRRRVVVGLALWFLVNMGLSYWRITTQPAAFDARRAVLIAAGESKALEMLVSAETRTAIQDAMALPNRRTLLAISSGSPLRLEWTTGEGTSIPLRSDAANRWHCDDGHALQLALKARRWIVHIRNEGEQPASVTGWQALGIGGREWEAAESEIALPSIEIRVVDATTDFPHLIAF